MNRLFGFPVGLRVVVLLVGVVSILAAFGGPPGVAPGEHGGVALGAVMFAVLATGTFLWAGLDAGRVDWRDDMSRWGVVTVLVGLGTVTVAGMITIGDTGDGGPAPATGDLAGQAAFLALLLWAFAGMGVCLGNVFWSWYRRARVALQVAQESFGGGVPADPVVVAKQGGLVAAGSMPAAEQVPD